MKKRKIHFCFPRRGNGSSTELTVLSDGTRVLYIDIGNLPKAKAEQYVKDIIKKCKK